MNGVRAAILSSILSLVLSGCASEGPVEDRSDDYLLRKDTPVAIEARRDVLQSPSGSDERRVQLEALRILAAQDDEDGSWNHDPTETGRALVNLHALNVLSKDDLAVKRAVSFLLGRDVPFVAQGSDTPAWGKDWIALYAVNRWEYGEELRARETVHALLDNVPQWLEGKDGRAACVILRAVTIHPLLQEREKRERIIEILRERQLPSGSWDLGPGTSPVAVLAAILPLADDPRVMEQVNRFLPVVFGTHGGLGDPKDAVLSEDEAHLAVVHALKLAGRLESYRKGQNLAKELAPYEVGLYAIAREGAKGHALKFQDRIVTISPEPLLLGTAISRWREILSPDDEAPLLRLLLEQKARENLDRVLADDPEAEVALLLRGKVIAVRPLGELRDQEGLAVKGLAEEDATGLVEAVSSLEVRSAQAIGEDEKR